MRGGGSRLCVNRLGGTAGACLKLLLNTSMTVPMYQYGWGKICQPNSDQGCIIWMVVVSASHCGRRSIAVEALQLSLHLYNPLHLSHPSTSPLQSSTALQPSTALYSPLQLYSYTSSTLYNPLQHPSGRCAPTGAGLAVVCVRTHTQATPDVERRGADVFRGRETSTAWATP